MLVATTRYPSLFCWLHCGLCSEYKIGGYHRISLAALRIQEVRQSIHPKPGARQAVQRLTQGWVPPRRGAPRRACKSFVQPCGAFEVMFRAAAPPDHNHGDSLLTNYGSHCPSSIEIAARGQVV